MTSAAEISSLSSTLSELHDRVTALAESALSSGDEDMAHELIAVERALGGALRRLRLSVRAGAPAADAGRGRHSASSHCVEDELMAEQRGGRAQHGLSLRHHRAIAPFRHFDHCHDAQVGRVATRCDLA